MTEYAQCTLGKSCLTCWFHLPTPEWGEIDCLLLRVPLPACTGAKCQDHVDMYAEETV